MRDERCELTNLRQAIIQIGQLFGRFSYMYFSSFVGKKTWQAIMKIVP